MKAGKTAVATALGVDVSDIERYQDTRFRGVYTDGTHYYACGKDASRLPDDWAWEPVPGTDWFTRVHGLVIYRAKEG